MTIKYPGKLIVLEGLDGSGKTAQVRNVIHHLRSEGFQVANFREPGGTEIGEKIRDILLNCYMDPLTELMLFTSARVELITKHIVPMLKSNHIVVLDRFIDSTFAYQGFGRGLYHTTLYLERLVIEHVCPDLVFYLDVDMEVAQERAKHRGALNRLDNLSDEIKLKIRQGYTERLSQHPERTIRIDANKDIDQVWDQIKLWLDQNFIPCYSHLQIHPLKAS